MPCRSDYMDPSGQELESIRVCEHIIYLFKKLKKPVPSWITEAANDYYGNINRLDEATKILCETCRSLTTSEQDEIIYNGRKEKARALASWWENHQEWDRRRVAEEKKAVRKSILKERALKKLTPEEIKALGL